MKRRLEVGQERLNDGFLDVLADPVESRDHVGNYGSGADTLVRGEPSENVHLAFPVSGEVTAGEFHHTALAAGYRDIGPPDERRYHPGYYGAFVLDPDGNNVEAVHHNR